MKPRFLRSIADHPLVAIVVAAATVVGAIFAVIAVMDPKNGESEESAISVDPVSGLTPRCLTLHGTAPDLDGKQLWVAFRSLGESEFCYLLPSRDADRNRWRVKDVVGDGTGGRTHEFFVFFVDNSLSEFMKSIRPVSDNGEFGVHYYTTQLPPGVSVDQPDITLVSAEDSEPCT
jgi:hypothetical protein